MTKGRIKNSVCQQRKAATGDASQSNEPAHPFAAMATSEVASSLNSLNESDSVPQRKKEEGGKGRIKVTRLQCMDENHSVDVQIFIVKYVNKFL